MKKPVVKRNKSKREAWVTARTLPQVKKLVQAESRRQHRSESDVIHLLLCQHFGVNPSTGAKDQDLETKQASVA